MVWIVDFERLHGFDVVKTDGVSDKWCHYDIQNITDKKAGDAFKNDQTENSWRNFRTCGVSDPLEAVTPDRLAAWMTAHFDEITEPKP